MKNNKKKIFLIATILMFVIFVLSTIIHLTNVEISDIESIEVNKPVQLFQQYFKYEINFTDKSIIYEKKIVVKLKLFVQISLIKMLNIL